nr:MAG TPA: Lamin Tail Domain [Caudoviricetes sp.]
MQIIDNFNYKGKKSNFERDKFLTIAQMKAFPSECVDEGHLSYCEEDGNHYEFKDSNEFLETTGKWRVWNPGTEVKLDFATTEELDAALNLDSSPIDPSPGPELPKNELVVGSVIFNEVSGDKQIELYNPTEVSVSLKGCYIRRTDETGTVDPEDRWYHFQDESLASKAFKVLVAKTDTAFGLSGSKKWLLELFDETGKLISSATNNVVTTNTEINSSTECVILSSGQSLGRTTDGATTWSLFTKSSIGQSNSNGTLYVKPEPSEPEIPTAGKIIFNEISGNKEIELYNPTDSDVDLSNWVLKRMDERDVLDDSTVWYHFGVGRTITSHEHLVLIAKTDTAFGLSGSKKWTLILENSSGEEVDRVTNAMSTTNMELTNLMTCIPLEVNQTLGRTVDGSKTWSVFQPGSIGQSNSNGTLYVKPEAPDAPELVEGSVVFNEIDPNNKKMELYNLTDSELSLVGYTIQGYDETQTARAAYTIQEGYAVAVIPSKGHGVLKFKVADPKMGPSYGLSATKAWRFDLIDPSGNTVDSINNYTSLSNYETTGAIDLSTTGYTMGRTTDGAKTWSVFTEGSIGQSNSNGTLLKAVTESTLIKIATYNTTVPGLSGLTTSTDRRILYAVSDNRGSATENISGVKGGIYKLTIDGSCTTEPQYLLPYDCEAITIDKDNNLYVAVEGRVIGSSQLVTPGNGVSFKDAGDTSGQCILKVSAPSYNTHELVSKVDSAKLAAIMTVKNQGFEGLTWISDDIFLIGNQSDPTQIIKYSLSQGVLDTWNSLNSSEIAELSYDAKTETLFVLDSKEGKIYRYSMDKKLKAIYTLPKLDDTIGIDTLNPEAMVVDRVNNCLWLATEFDMKLHQLLIPDL